MRKLRQLCGRLLPVLLCVIMALSLLPERAVAQVTPNNDGVWITDCNTAIGSISTGSTWKTYLSDVFYREVSFAKDNTGSLEWDTQPRTGVYVWNGKEPADLTPNPEIALNDQKDAAQADEDKTPAFDAVSLTYYVYSPQQLLFALRTLQAGNLSGYTISIQQDLDMGGALGYDWPDDIVLLGANTIEGNHKTIYNLRVRDLGTANADSERASGLIREAATLVAHDLTFKNANVLGFYQAGALVGYFEAPNEAMANLMDLDNICVKDSLIVSYKSYAGGIRSNGAGGIFGRRQSDSPAYRGGSITNCNVQDSVIASLNHTGSMTSALNNMDLVSHCFSVGCSVISFGEHSGGLFSCIAGVVEISDCFVDAQVYCSTDGGVFSGAAGSCHIYDCFVSGFVEGTTRVGGFLGSTGAGTTSTAVNCYSTALVGLRSESTSTSLGGFVGAVTDYSGYNFGFVNCYAAGEVGAAGTSVALPAASTTPQANLAGGFAGSCTGLNYGASGNSGRNSLTYCYYDKQTTAMREWNLGTRYQGYLTTRTQGNPTVLGSYCAAGEIGVLGVLTTDTVKAGAGLTGLPDTTGFQGFKDMSGFYSYSVPDTNTSSVGKSAITTYNGWDYSATNHYPELKVFSQAATNGEWGVWGNLVAAYSKSSTSCAMLETWEKGLNSTEGVTDGAPLSALVYDTVRDLTLHFPLTTAAGQTWQRTGTQTGVAGVDKAVTYIGSESDPANAKDVLALNAGTPYNCDSFVPGIEWLETEVTIGNDTATRRFRVTPTAGVDAGKGVTIYRPGVEAQTNRKIAAFYDHANDVELYFSTVERMAASNNKDITTGIYPDAGQTGLAYGADYMTRDSDPLTPRQLEMMSNSTESSLNAYFVGNGTDDSYGDSGKRIGGVLQPNFGLDVGYMARQESDTIDAMTIQDNNAKDTKLYVYVRDVTSISMSGQITAEGEMMDMTLANNADTYNGLALQSHGDQILLFEYIWELADGRLVYDAKLISVKATPFAVRMDVYDAGGLESTVADAVKAANDVSNGLHDTNDAKVGLQMLTEHKDDDEVKAALETPNDRTWDELYVSMTDPATGTTRIDPKTGLPITASDIGPEYGDTVVAAWQVTNPDKTVARLHVSLDSGREDEHGDKVYFHTTITNPKEGSTVVVDYEYYRYVIAENGHYYVRIEHVPRTYTVHEDNGVFYLAFNNTGTGPGDVETVDVANNIQIELELTTTLQVKKTVTGTLGDQNMDFDFTVTLDDDQLGGAGQYPLKVLHKDGTQTVLQDGMGAPLILSKATPANVSLKHGDTLVILGLQYGTVYSLKENDYTADGYTTRSDGNLSNTITQASMSVTATSPSSPTGTHSADRLHNYVNSKNPAPPTGINLHNGALLCMILLPILAAAALIVSEILKKKYRENH